MMEFFKKIKEKLEVEIIDLGTVDFALLERTDAGDKVLAYRHQQPGGDSLVYMDADNPPSKVQIELFNAAFAASITARTGITQFLIESLTKR